MKYRLRFTKQANADLKKLHDYIAEQAGLGVADAYIDRIEAACRPLIDNPAIGTPRDQLRLGLRSLAFERRATILYHVRDRTILIERVAPKGVDLKQLFRPLSG